MHFPFKRGNYVATIYQNACQKIMKFIRYSFINILPLGIIRFNIMKQTSIYHSIDWVIAKKNQL